MNILIIIIDVKFSLKTTSLATSSFDMGVKVWVAKSENVSSVIKEIGWHLNELNFGWIQGDLNQAPAGMKLTKVPTTLKTNG